MPHFICVRFQVDGRIVVVHESWLVGEAHCRWPQSGSIEEMVKLMTKPKSEWGVWEIDILGGDDDYETCARRAYSTQQSWGGVIPKPTCTTVPPPPPTSITPQPAPSDVRYAMDYINELGRRNSDIPRESLTPIPAPPNPKKKKTSTTTSDHEKSSAEIKATLARLEESVSIININLSLRLKTIEDKLKPLLEGENASSNAGKRSPPHERQSLTVLPPATTMGELDEWLDNQNIFAVSKRVSCTQLRATVRMFVKTVMKKSLAKTFSWSGLGNRRLRTKTSFKDHKIFNFLIDVLHETQHRHSSEAEIADSIKKVLAGVGDWDGGRTARFSSYPTIAFFP
ncbi:uncharacterized protein LOC120337623 isoform X1 [Styela clava]